AAILDHRIPALQFDAEGIAAEALFAAAIDAPGIRLPASPFVQRSLRLAGRKIPKARPTDRQQHETDRRQGDQPGPPGARGARGANVLHGLVLPVHALSSGLLQSLHRPQPAVRRGTGRTVNALAAI